MTARSVPPRMPAGSSWPGPPPARPLKWPSSVGSCDLGSSRDRGLGTWDTYQAAARVVAGRFPTASLLDASSLRRRAVLARRPRCR